MSRSVSLLATLVVAAVPGASEASPGSAAGLAQDAAARLAQDAAARLAQDAEAGRPLVVHVFVALADNDAQGIVPVSKRLGDGASPRTNLYWGARYGVGHFLARDAGWRRVAHEGAPPPPEVLERIVLEKSIAKRRVVLVADAWAGPEIRAATVAFLRAAAGHDPVRVGLPGLEIEAGGAAHVVAYIGHDGLMDFELPPQPGPDPEAEPRSAIVLACISRTYFGPRLARAGAHPLLTTTQLMAPEAYTLDAALVTWLSGEGAAKAHRAAAAAYCKYQGCSLKAGLRLFATGA